MSVEERLQDLGIELPDAMAPVANYRPFVLSDGLLSISGQLPKTANGHLITGKLGMDLDVDAGQYAARLCAINIIAQIKAAIDDLEKVTQIVKLTGFVACVNTFQDQPQVINGASDVMADVFGDKGRHSRSAVGVNALPLGVAVEVDALVAVNS